MAKSYKYLFYILLVSNMLFIFSGLLEDKQQMLPAGNNYLDNNKIDLVNQFKKHDNLKTDFPYSIYLKSNNFQDAINLQHDIKILDSLFIDKSLVQQFIYTILTDSLYQRNYKNQVETNLDSLNTTLQWAEKFKYYGELDKENQILFQAIHTFWLSKISNILAEYSENDDSRKFNFQYRYLVAKCNEKRFNVSVKVSSVEKFIENLLENRWAHLFEASWHQSSMLQKIVIFLLFVTTIFAYFILLKFSFEKKS